MRTDALMSAMAVLAVVAAGCGHGGTPGTAGTPTTAPPDTSPSTDAAEWPGKMIATYEAATSPEAVTGRDFMKGEHLLEDLAEGMTDLLKLPYDIPLVGKECGEANAYWVPDEKSIILCYEDAADALNLYTNAGDDDPAASAINSEVATFFHETGHMVIDLYDLPITGREEDVADQLAAYILLTPGADGKVDSDSVQAVKDFARLFKGSDEQNGGEIDQGALADTHSLSLTRMYNLQCWVYGADPVANADLVGDELLPQDRADGCEEEFAKLSSAWDTLLGPYVK